MHHDPASVLLYHLSLVWQTSFLSNQQFLHQVLPPAETPANILVEMRHPLYTLYHGYNST